MTNNTHVTSDELDFDVTRQTYVELISRDKLEEGGGGGHEIIGGKRKDSEDEDDDDQRWWQRGTGTSKLITYGTEFIEANLSIAVFVSIDDRLARRTVCVDSEESRPYLVDDLLQLRIFQIRSNHHL